MFRKIGAAALAATALMLSAPAAQADAPIRTCRFVAVGSGTDYSGIAYGSVTHAEVGPVEITCYISVNGVPVSSTTTGAGVGTAVTAGPLSFTAHDGDVVRICTIVTTSHGGFDECFETTHQTEPLTPVAHGQICAVTYEIGKRIFNILGILEIDPQGNVKVFGSVVYDCVTYYDGLPVPIRYA